MEEAVERDGEPATVALEGLARGLASEAARPDMAEAPLHPLQRRQEEDHRRVDPAQLARTLSDIATVGPPLGVALAGRTQRVPDARRCASHVRSVTDPREAGEADRRGQLISEAGNRRLRRTSMGAGGTAGKLDP